jgi:hypothetical protein
MSKNLKGLLGVKNKFEPTDDDGGGGEDVNSILFR